MSEEITTLKGHVEIDGFTKTIDQGGSAYTFAHVVIAHEGSEASTASRIAAQRLERSRRAAAREKATATDEQAARDLVGPYATEYTRAYNIRNRDALVRGVPTDPTNGVDNSYPGRLGSMIPNER